MQKRNVDYILMKIKANRCFFKRKTVCSKGGANLDGTAKYNLNRFITKNCF